MRKLVTGIVLALGCAHANSDLLPIVRKKAAFELACPEDQLTATEFATQEMSGMTTGAVQKTFGVEGCGKRVSYRAYCAKMWGMGEACDAQQASAPVSVSGGDR